METTNVLDVRPIEQRLKHPSIFNSYNQLGAGENLLLINDHDPLPLYYQFQAEFPGQFTWQYQEKGPQQWVVSITRQADSGETLGDLVNRYPKAAAVFKKLNIDFCCKGKRRFTDVCQEAGLIPGEVMEQIRTASASKGNINHSTEWTIPFLIDYIVQNHHGYVRQSVEQIQPLLEKVVNVHGPHFPQLYQVADYFETLSEELFFHMQKEEVILFPAIRELVRAIENPQSSFACAFGTLEVPVHVMEDDHTAAGELLEKLNRLTNGYQAPANACNSFRLLYQLLEEFQDDLHQHVHLENNLLFPKALALESQLSQLA